MHKTKTTFENMDLKKMKMLMNDKTVLVDVREMFGEKQKETFMTPRDAHEHENNNVFSYQRFYYKTLW